MTVLVDDEIRNLVESHQLIEGFRDSSLQGASYDMGLGHMYLRNGEAHALTQESPTLSLEPGEFAVLTSLESLHMPRNLIGHNGVMSSWAKRGLVSLFSPQIDPGFEGILNVPVFNGGDSPIRFTFEEKIFTVEFERTTGEASYGWSDKYGVQNRISSPMTPIATRPNLADISKLAERTDKLEGELDRLRNEFQLSQAQLLGQLTATTERLSGEVKVVSTRVSDMLTQKGLRMARRSYVVAVAALLTALVLGIASSQWITGLLAKIPH